MNHSIQLNLFHALFVAPLILLVSYKLNANKEVGSIEKMLFMILGLAVISYHGWKAINRQLNGESIANSYGFQINVMHALFIGPVIGWCGYKLYNGKMPTDLEKTVLLMLGIIALVYHSLQVYKKYNKQ